MRNAGLVALLLAAAIFGIWIWPTPYRHDKLRMGNSEVMVRVHRFKDTVEYMAPSGEWRPMRRPPAAGGLDPDVKSGLEGKGSTMDPDVERALKSSPAP
jgi:hypothetical protein